MRAAAMQSLPPAQRATQYVQLGYDYLGQGLLPEAEQEFQSAIASDPKSSAAYAGLAQVREQSGTPDEARAEAQTSIKLQPNAAAYLVLARLDLKEDKLPSSASDVANALAHRTHQHRRPGHQTSPPIPRSIPPMKTTNHARPPEHHKTGCPIFATASSSLTVGIREADTVSPQNRPRLFLR